VIIKPGITAVRALSYFTCMDFFSGALQSEFLRKRIISFLREDE
jgi:hypothetical protein